MIRRGEIWWCDLGTPRGSGAGYLRPLLIVQDDSINRSVLRTTIVIALTSNLARGSIRDNVLLPASQTGLTKDSVAIPTTIETIDKADLLARAGILSQDLLERVELSILSVLGLAP